MYLSLFRSLERDSGTGQERSLCGIYVVYIYVCNVMYLSLFRPLEHDSGAGQERSLCGIYVVYICM